MKKILLVLSLLLPLCLAAQKSDNADMSKYLSGAVPEKEGKVVFTKQINAPGLSMEQIYNISRAWLDTTLKENKNRSAIISADEAQGTLTGINEHYLVFKSSAFSLDRATISYAISINALDNKCILQVSSIKYLYNGSQKATPDRYSAEEWITDSNALNKTKTKMYPGMAKFRTKTIDKVDELAESLRKDIEAGIVKNARPAGIMTASTVTATTTVVPGAVTAATVAPVTATTIATPVTNITVTTPVTATVATTPVAYTATTANAISSNNNTVMEGYKSISPDKIPGNIIKMLSEDWMLITAGDNTRYNTMTASWGGLGVLYNKPVAICFINPARYTYQLMEKGDTYTLTFYTEAYRDALNYCGKVSGRDTDKIKGSGLTPITTPDGSKAFSQAWMIIECRKLVSQSISLDAINNSAEKERRSTQPMHKMYIGEILNVWVK